MRLAVFLIATQLAAQVTVRYSPEPMAVPQAVLANARDMGRWLVTACNSPAGQSVLLPWERVAMAAESIAFIDPDDALLVLTAHVQRSPANRLLIGLRYAGGIAAIGLAVASRSNWAWSTGIGVGAGVIPDVVALVQSSVPSATPLVSTVRWPIILQPGQCITDHWFAGKMRAPRPVTAVIRVSP
jgi:hypothetical protein